MAGTSRFSQPESGRANVWDVIEVIAQSLVLPSGRDCQDIFIIYFYGICQVARPGPGARAARKTKGRGMPRPYPTLTATVAAT